MAVATTTLLAYAAIAATVAGTAVSAYGQQQQRKIAVNTANYNAKLAENQAIQDDLEARENARRTRERNLMFAGEQRAAIAKGGVAEVGSPLEVLAYSAGRMELQLQDEKRAAESRRRLGFNQADSIRNAGLAQGMAYNTATYGTILSGLSSAGSMYGSAKYTGAIG